VKLLLVEDTYGVKFHKAILEKLQEAIGVNTQGLVVRRVPAKECNEAITRKVKAILAPDVRGSKVVIVVDSEGMNPDHAAGRVTTHFEDDKLLSGRVRVVVVIPRHESWLCIGLGLRASACRNHPEDAIVRARGLKSYSKEHLGKLAKHADVRKLMGEKDFRKYVDAIKWVLEDP